MYKELDQVLKELPELTKDITKWGSLIINRRRPHTYRAFRVLDSGIRVCLHRFEPCTEEEAFLHPHPWPSAMFILQGAYRMKVGFSPDLKSEPQIILDTVFAAGSCYAMTNPLGWHSVQPLETCLSVMVNGAPWDAQTAHAKAPTTKGKDLDKMTPEDLEKHIRTIKYEASIWSFTDFKPVQTVSEPTKVEKQEDTTRRFGRRFNRS